MQYVNGKILSFNSSTVCLNEKLRFFLAPGLAVPNYHHLLLSENLSVATIFVITRKQSLLKKSRKMSLFFAFFIEHKRYTGNEFSIL